MAGRYASASSGDARPRTTRCPSAAKAATAVSSTMASVPSIGGGPPAGVAVSVAMDVPGSGRQASQGGVDVGADGVGHGDLPVEQEPLEADAVEVGDEGRCL